MNINVCENPEPVREVRRIYDAVSETLGFRELRQFAGNDVIQLKVMLHALGYFRSGSAELDLSEDGLDIYGADAMEAVDGFRSAQQWGTAVNGFVDAKTIECMWERLAERGLADEVREAFLELARVRR